MTDPHNAPDQSDRAALDEASDAGAPARRKKPMIEATRSVTFRDFLIFQLKLLLDGAKDFVLFQLAIVAIVVDAPGTDRVRGSPLRRYRRAAHGLQPRTGRVVG